MLLDWYLEKADQCDTLTLTAANERQRTKLQIEAGYGFSSLSSPPQKSRRTPSEEAGEFTSSRVIDVAALRRIQPMPGTARQAGSPPATVRIAAIRNLA